MGGFDGEVWDFDGLGGEGCGGGWGMGDGGMGDGGWGVVSGKWRGVRV